MTFDVIDMTPRIGSEIRTDVETLLSGAQAQNIRHTLEQRGVVFFRGLDISDAQQVAIARTLGNTVDSEGEVLDILVQRRRDKVAASKLMRKLLKKQGIAPTELVTDRLRAYGAAGCELGLGAEHIQGKGKNNRAEGPHVSIRLREQKMRGFRSPGSAQRFLAAHAAVANTFTTCRHLISAATHRKFRAEAFAAWRDAAELAA